MNLDTPTDSHETPQEQVYDSQPSALPLGCTCGILVVIGVLAFVAVPVAFILGGSAAETQQYHRRAMHQTQRIESFSAEHPDKFGNLTVEEASNGWAYPVGSVKTQADYDLLDDRLHEMFGDELAEQMIYVVDVDGD